MRSELNRIIAKHQGRPGSLLPILHEVQENLGHVPAACVPVVAQALNLSRAEVHGTISFYHDFRRELVTKPVIKLCRAEACKARGVDRIAPILEADPRVVVEPIYCLGLCANGPSAMIGRKVFAGLDEQRARQLADRVASQ